MTLEDRVNPHIRDLSPYVPGKRREELERELGITNSIKLASNESALGPSPKALAAVRGFLDGVHRYPDGVAHALRTKLSGRLDVDPGQLVFGCGSSELLELLAKCFLAPGDEVVFAWPSFSMYPIIAAGHGARCVRVPLDADLMLDLAAMAAAVGDRTKIVIVCNPNNPTGTSVGADAFDTFATSLPDDVVLVIDEAYCEYARRSDFPDSLAWVRRRPGTIVLRTFSKIYGLAGMRVGYGIADPEIAEYLQRARHPFNVTLLAQVAANAALDDEEHVARSRRTTAEGIDYLTRELRALDMEVWPTDANFLLVRTGPDVCESLLREGVIIRPLREYELLEHARISIGTHDENERLVKALQRIRAQRRGEAPRRDEAPRRGEAPLDKARLDEGAQP